ncbi:hypothetical protein [Sphingomonas bacterium]|uniref:hypothetical protein n=1 Tax=Sphingomonas bacterium TaxID=1895847 RepID=UPI0015753732|nr:hypothetical protein [Sphingomonas bacterium]
MGRILAGIVLGAIIAFGCVWTIEAISGAFYPLPTGFDPYTTANTGVEMATVVPLPAKLLVVLGWCVGSLAGGAVAAWLSRRRIGAWIVAALIVAGALSTAAAITHPTWMVAAGLLLPWLCAWAVQDFARFGRAFPPRR